ncbi:MAG: hypothetical protein IJJ61_04005 [Clostridia bacterium]|nr:hypothetical protein [Clostridia bacterium]
MAGAAGSYKSEKFIMRRRTFFNSSNGLSCEKVNKLAFGTDNRLFAGTDKGLFVLKNKKFSQIYSGKLTGKISALRFVDDCLLAAQNNSIFGIKNGVLKHLRTFESDIVDIIYARNAVWVLTKERLVCSDKELKNDKINRNLEGGLGICMAVSDDDMYVVTEDYISLIHGKRNEWKNIIPQFSSMPESRIYSVDFDENGFLRLGTESGAVIYDNASRWIGADQVNCLPKNPVYKTVWDKCGGAYFATDIGVAYLKNGYTKYFSAERWVPDNKINDIAVSDDGSVLYAATDYGISEIKAEYTTLSDKAAYYEELIEKYHIRRGFTANRELDGYDIENGSVHISDNDGLWTGCYVAAESFRYAVTGSKDALKRARRGMNSMLFLTSISGIPGFTARAVRYPGEKNFSDGDKEWSLSPDKSCEWKGETSSDEITGHFFGLSIYYDLCANSSEKKKISAALCGMMDHIIRNDYRLVDKDGLPTTWACWNPELLNHSEKWFSEKGINSLELLGYLKVCHHISGDEQYSRLYNEFIKKHHYILNVMSHKIKDAHTCHIDDNLAFIASLTYLRLEDNAVYRSAVLCGMEDHWRYELPERQPMFSFIHAAFTGRDSDIADGIQSLREIPYDLVHYKMDNSGRKDLVWDNEQEAWHEPPQVKYALPYDEVNVHRPDCGSFGIDSQGGGAQDPTVYLLPYWIGRYFGIISED